MKHLPMARGFSLVELLVTLSIVSIIAAYTAPTFDGLLKKARQKSALSELISVINSARNTAIQEQISVTVCPLTADNKCGSDWSRPLVAFRDPNRTKIVSSENQVLRIIQLNDYGFLAGRTGIRNYFRFRPSGLAQEAIGNIVWCPDDLDTRYASQVRINMGGRPFVSKDGDGDGIPEDAHGQNLRCT